MDGEQRERLAEIYKDAPRDRLLRAGRDFLDGDLRIRARKRARWFWTACICLAAVAVFAAVVAVAYVLEKTRESAAGFERGREEQLRSHGLDPDG